MKLKKSLSEMTSAGAVASVPMSMNEEPIKRAPTKKKPAKKQWRNSLHEAQVSEADLAEQDLIISHGSDHHGQRGLMRNQAPHEAVQMAVSDLIQCLKNGKQIIDIIRNCDDPNIEPWVQEKIIKANDYLNTVAEYMEGQTALSGDFNMLEGKRKKVKEGYTVTRGIDKERYVERDGLEGPFQTKSGKVVYYDKKEGKYYDPDTDMYIEYEDYQAMNEEIETESNWMGEDGQGNTYEVVDTPSGAAFKVNGELDTQAGNGKTTDQIIKMLTAHGVTAQKQMNESYVGGANLLTALKMAQKSGVGYMIESRGKYINLTNNDVVKLVECYNKAIAKYPEKSVLGLFGNTNKVLGLLESSDGSKKFSNGDKVKVPHKGKTITGTIVRYDAGDKGGRSPFYVVDVGDYGSIDVSAHSVKGAEKIDEVKSDDPDYDKALRRFKRGLPPKQKIDEFSRTKLGDVIRAATDSENEDDPHAYRLTKPGREDLVRKASLRTQGFMDKPGGKDMYRRYTPDEDKQGVTEGRRKKNNEYAIGMAAAKEEAGITTKDEPVPKSVVAKGHRIAKAIKGKK